MSNWDGNDRRKDTREDSRELLIRVDETLQHLKRWTDNHKIEDDKRFDKLEQGIFNLTVIGSKMDALHDNMTKVVTHTEKQNGRIDKLEAWRNWMAGGMAAIGWFITLLWKK